MLHVAMESYVTLIIGILLFYRCFVHISAMTVQHVVKKRMYVVSTFWNHHQWKVTNFFFVYIEMQWHVRIKLDNCMFLNSIDNGKLSCNSFISCIAISCWKMILYKLKRRFCQKLCCPLKCTYTTMPENYAPLICTRECRAIMLLK